MPLLARLAWRNLWRAPGRSLLTLSATAFGTALLVFSVGLQLGSYDQMIAAAVRSWDGLLQVQRPGYRERPRLHLAIPRAGALARRLQGALARDRRLAGAVVARRAQAFVLLEGNGRARGARLAGVEPAREARITRLAGTVAQGRWVAGGRELVLGAGLARRLGIGVGGELAVLGTAWDGSVAADRLPVVGLFRSGVEGLDRGLALMPLHAFRELFLLGDRAHALVVGGLPVSRARDLEERVERLLPALAPEAAPGVELEALGWERLEPGLRQLIRLDFASGWLMYLLLVLVVVLGGLNTFLVSVLERRRELALLQALGLSPGRVFALVALEVAWLALLGVGVGLALGAAADAWLAARGLRFEGLEALARQLHLPAELRPRLSPFVLLAGPAVVLGLSLLAGLLPAARGARTDPARALREAGP